MKMVHKIVKQKVKQIAKLAKGEVLSNEKK
jgi:hypothetical protein